MATSEASVRPGLRSELLEASDATIEAAVAIADPMVLRGLIYQLTGDAALRDMKLKRIRIGRMDIAAPEGEAELAMVRRKAADFLKAYRDAGAGPIGHGPDARLPESLALIVGHEIMPRALDLMIEETALDPWARALEWQAPPDPARLAEFSVLVIGAGMGGLNAAVQLQRAGIRFHIVEKNDNVGGTWYENHYPGARVDTPSRSYTNLLGVDFPYPYAYGPHEESQKYFEWIADRFDLRGDISLETEVRALRWDEARGQWEVRTRGAGGEQVRFANAVITGVGFLNRPNLPDIPGMANFAGQSWHTARWPEQADWRGKKIAVIGTGCTGYQLVPELALKAAQVTVFQRTPQWLLPVPGYLAPSPPELLWLDRNLPFHSNFMRFKSFYGAGPDFAKIFDIDPDYDDPHCCSESNKAARERTLDFLKAKLGDATLDGARLVDIMTPAHPPWSARPVAVDADYSVLDALLMENVTLVTSGIERITPAGVEDKDGTRHEADIIVYATGFRATDFLFPMTITGRGGITIEEMWERGGARAYRGCMVPGFPNLWMLYGPNTNGGLPVAQFHEMTTLFAMQCIERLIVEDKAFIDVKATAYWRYNEELDRLNATKIWADPRAHNYWWTKHGRTASQIPYTGYEVREMLLRPDFDDMDLQ